jgi:N-acetylglucosaminyldiphosphoundecaprenol N-acetyl-beta-D-mannosaminyltransferase
MRVEFMDTPVDILTFDETVARADAAMRDKQPIVHVALNAAKLVKMRTDDELRADVTGADIIGIDGMAISWALKLLGRPGAPRVSGVDLMMALLQLSAEKGYRPFILGAKKDVLDLAVAEAKRRWPKIEFAGFRNGYYTGSDEVDIVQTIRASKADCLFLAMPTPRKERFLAAYSGKVGVPFIMGVGGSVDVLAGHVSRAPQWMQNSGLEWLHRLLQEPGKMFWRYASTNSRFILLLLGALLSGKRVKG